MKNKLLLVLIAALVAGCVDKVKYAIALKDPITLNLVKQSIGDSMTQPYSTVGQADYVHNYYNSCGWLWLSPAGAYRQISCDALDLRLNNKSIAVSASSLVAYYMNEQAEWEEKTENQRIKDKAAAKQTQIENMANGRE